MFLGWASSMRTPEPPRSLWNYLTYPSRPKISNGSATGLHGQPEVGVSYESETLRRNRTTIPWHSPSSGIPRQLGPGTPSSNLVQVLKEGVEANAYDSGANEE